MSIKFPGEIDAPIKPDLESVESFDNSYIGAVEKYGTIGTLQSTVDSLTVLDIRSSDGTQLLTCDTVNKWVEIGGAPAAKNQDPNVSLFVTRNINSYHAVNVINNSQGALASTNIGVINDDSDLTYTSYVDMGINGTGWADPEYAVFDAGAGYIYCGNNNFYVGTQGVSSNLYFFVGGVDSKNYIKGTVTANGSLLLGTSTDGMTAEGSIAIAQDLAHRGTKVGFYNTAPVAKPTGVAVSAAGIHAALVSLGLIAA